MWPLVASVMIGIGATALFDLWIWLVSRTGIAGPPAWTLPGRWFGHVARGRFLHEGGMAGAEPIPNETTIGWLVHYLIGVIYAGIVVSWGGSDWLAAPTLLPPLVVGLVTVLAGWLIMSPGMGNGIAGARTDRPGKTRALQLAAHTVFGLAMWIIALVISPLA